jgi:hypothetical protein
VVLFGSTSFPAAAGRRRPLRISDGPPGVDRLAAVLINDTWEKACGKLPSVRPVDGSYSSDSKPTSLLRRRKRSKISRASSVRPEGEVVGQPKGGHQEGTLAAFQAIDAAIELIPTGEALVDQLLLDRGDCTSDAGIVRGEKTHRREHQQAGVKQLRPVIRAQPAWALLALR